MSREAFKTWLIAHRVHLKQYASWEVARLALACGFTMEEIAPDLTDWIALSRRKLALWESPLFEHWVSLSAYQHGKEWDM